MARNRLLVLIVVVANASILVGIPVFGWTPATVAALVVIDVLLAIIRTTMEKTFAARPPDETALHSYDFSLIGDYLIEKRGSFRVPAVPVSVYPRNLAYVLRSLLAVTFFAAFAFGAYYANGAPAGRPDIRGFDPTLAAGVPLLVAKHVSIVAVWAADGVYERASIETIRPRERLLSAIVGLVAVGLVLISSPETVVVAVIIALVPKLLFDLREAGIGPSLLTFDPACERHVAEVSLPADSPPTVFRTDRRALLSTVLTIHTPLLVVIFVPAVFGLVAGMAHSLVGLGSGMWGWIAVIAITTAIVYGGALAVLWIEYGDVEYRIYDDTVVTYDSRLQAVQWDVPLEEISSVSAEHSLFTRIAPFCGPTVHIEYRTDDPPVDTRVPRNRYKHPKRIPYLKQPASMVSAIDRARSRLFEGG